MKRKHSLSYRILRWIVIVVSLFLIVASLFIEPYWHVDISVWKAIALLWGSVGLYGLVEKAVSGEDIKWKWGDSSIEITGKNHKKNKEQNTSK